MIFPLRRGGIYMKMIHSISELKKGDTVIVKNSHNFEAKGYKSISGDIYEIEIDNPIFTIRCKETENIEKISLKDGIIFLIRN